MKQPIYITTTLPYVNADPHVGFAMELVRADALARYYALQGHEVFFNTGTDEHGIKIYEKAIEAGIGVQEYVDQYSQRFKGLHEILGISDTVHFIRTTDDHHMLAAQKFWQLCNDNGYIYKKTYQAKYCVGCELEKTDSDLVNGECPEHPGKELQLIDEENYFFTFSAFGDRLLDYYKNHPDFITPEFRANEIVAFIQRGLQDFSISRLATKMPWGIPVPDDDHVMYVWFDALVNYISTLGWGSPDESLFEKFWVNGTTIQYAGKDNLRQQTAMWQAMLMAAGLPLTNHIAINGFINSGGVKMSKSIGNVISPYDIVAEYGTDALRYYLLRHVQPFEDTDMTMEKFKEIYNANLANGLGNLISRVMNMVITYDVSYDESDYASSDILQSNHDAITSFRYNVAMDAIWKTIGESDEMIAREQPYKTIKTDPDKAHGDLVIQIQRLGSIAHALVPFMPATAEVIMELLDQHKKPETPLFLRAE